MDNQQTISWFVGILEGEGSFRIRSNTEVRISNTERDLIDFCSNFLKQNFILNNIYDWKRPNRKREYEISIYGYNDCMNLYKLINSKMECRLNEFQRILKVSETTREDSSDLYWLIGIMEAEGSLYINLRKRAKANLMYEPEIYIGNTNLKIIEKVYKTFYTLKLPCYIWNKQHPNVRWKDEKRIKISGYKRVQRVLEILDNLWISKKYSTRAKLLKEFVDSRLMMNISFPYTHRQHEIYHTLENMI